MDRVFEDTVGQGGFCTCRRGDSPKKTKDRRAGRTKEGLETFSTRPGPCNDKGVKVHGKEEETPRLRESTEINCSDDLVVKDAIDVSP